MKLDAYERFSRLNSSFWNEKQEIDNTQKRIFCYVGTDLPVCVIETLLFAKRISLMKKKALDAFLGVNDKKSLIVYESFNVDSVVSLKHPTVFDKIKYVIYALNWSKKYFNKALLRNAYYKGIYIGDIIYDTIIRSMPNVYTVNELKIQYIRYIASVLYAVDLALENLDCNTYDTFIYANGDYTNKVFVRIAQQYKMDVFEVNRGRIYLHKEVSHVCSCMRITKELVEYYKEKISAQQIEDFLTLHFLGTNGANLDKNAYFNKKKYTRSQLFEAVKEKEKTCYTPGEY